MGFFNWWVIGHKNKEALLTSHFTFFCIILFAILISPLNLTIPLAFLGLANWSLWQYSKDKMSSDAS